MVVVITVIRSMFLCKKEICVVSPSESCNDSFGAARTRTCPFSSDSAYGYVYIINDLVKTRLFELKAKVEEKNY